VGRRPQICVLLVAMLAAGALWGGSASAHTYGGRTADDGRISFRFSPDEPRIIQLFAERELRCRKGKVRSFRRGAFRQTKTFARVAPDGRFRGTIRTRGVKGSLVRRGRFTIRGRAVNERFALGVFRERLRLRDGSRCDSGRIRFRIPLTSTNE
jgi:hypothetical protein